MATVSVIVPMYNVRPYIGECLESLKNQTYEDFEAICIDDGSTDGTLEVARAVVGDDERFVFVSQKNAGLSASRNVGIELAEGRYVLFLDSDDYYESQTLQMLLNRVEHDGLDVLFFSARTVYEDAAIRASYRDDYDGRTSIDGIMAGQDLLVQFVAKDSFRVSAVLQLVRRDFLGESGIRFYEGIVHEDNMFTGLILANAQRAEFLNEPLYVRRVRADSIMTVKRELCHVYGHFKSAYELEKWLRAHLTACRLGFAQSLLHHIAFCYDRAAFDALSLDERKLEQRAGELGGDEELSFRLHVIEHANEMRAVRSEYIDSTSYKVGSAMMALPCWVKDRLRR